MSAVAVILAWAVVIIAASIWWLGLIATVALLSLVLLAVWVGASIAQMWSDS